MCGSCKTSPWHVSDNDNIDFLIRFGSMCSQLDLLQAIFMLIYEETKVLEL